MWNPAVGLTNFIYSQMNHSAIEVYSNYAQFYSKKYKISKTHEFSVLKI
jgi:hypothetical protein